jgi:hypothetical protein
MKAEELRLENEAVLSNVMCLFDKNLVTHNQLVTKRKYILPFIKLNADEAGKYFLLGIEALIEICNDDLFADTCKILMQSFSLGYFTSKSYTDWLNTDNKYIISDTWSKDYRKSTEKIKHVFVSPQNDTIDDEPNTDTSTDSDSDTTTDEFDNEDLDSGKITQMCKGVKFDSSLFNDNDPDKMEIDELFADPPPYDANDTVPPLYNSSVKGQPIPYEYTEKLWCFDNPYQSTYIHG